MKKTIVTGILIAFSFLTVLAQKDKGHKGDWEKKEKIEGSGKIVTKEISVQSFDELSVNGVFNVSLSQGNKEQVKIEADDNLQELFEVKNEGSKLKITTKKDVNYSSKKKVTVYITFKSLKSLDLQMVGNLASEGNLNFGNLAFENHSVGSVDMKLAAQKLDIKNNSVGTMKLSGKADNATVKHNGVGSFKATDLVVQTMDIEAEGVGSAEVNAVKELKVKDSFLGKVKNVGAATVKKKVTI